MPYQNLHKIEWTTLEEFLTSLNANFAMIQNSPLFKGLPGESVQGEIGEQGVRGAKFLFVRYSRFADVFDLHGGSITVEFLNQNTEGENFQNLLLALETDDLIDGDVVILDSTTEMVEVSTNSETSEILFVSTGIYLSQEIAAITQLTNLYNNTVNLINSITIEQNVVIDRFKTIGLAFGYPSSANIEETTIQANSVYYPYIENVSDFLNSGVNLTESTSEYNHLHYALSKDKFTGIHNYTFVTGNVQDLIDIYNNTQHDEDSTTSLYHLPTRDFIPAQILIQNNAKEGLLIGVKNKKMNNFSRLFKNSRNEFVITSKFEHDTAINNGEINSDNFDKFNYGLFVLGENRLSWNKEFFNYGTFRLQGDLIQTLYGDINQTILTKVDTPFLKTRQNTWNSNVIGIDLGFKKPNEKPYENSLLTLFSDKFRLVDHQDTNGYSSKFLFTDENGYIRKDIRREHRMDTSNMTTFYSSFLDHINLLNPQENINSVNMIVTSKHIANLIRMITGISGYDSLPHNFDLRNFENAWLKQDFAPRDNNYESGKVYREEVNENGGIFGYERIPSIELNRNLIVGKSTTHSPINHKGDEVFMVLQGKIGDSTGYFNSFNIVTIGNLKRSVIKPRYAADGILGDCVVDDGGLPSGDSDSVLFMKWKEMYYPGLKPRTILSVSSTENYGEVKSDWQYAELLPGVGNIPSLQFVTNHTEPTGTTESELIQYIGDNISKMSEDDGYVSQDVHFEIALALKDTKYVGGSDNQPFRQKLLSGSHWRIIWSTFDRLRKYIKKNFYSKQEIDSFVTPLGTVIAWTPLQPYLRTPGGIPHVKIPKGWVPCFGGRVQLTNGKSYLVPDLVDSFVMGEKSDKFYVDNGQIRAKGGLIKPTEGYNSAYISKENIPPHFHQHTHDANGIIKARVVFSKKNKPSGWNLDNPDQFTNEIYIDQTQIVDKVIPGAVINGGDGSFDEMTYNPVAISPNGAVTPKNRYPREWSTNKRNTSQNHSVPKDIDYDLLPPGDNPNIRGIGAVGNDWEGVYGGAKFSNFRVQDPFEIVSKHLKLIYIYRVGENVENYYPGHSDIQNQVFNPQAQTQQNPETPNSLG